MGILLLGDLYDLAAGNKPIIWMGEVPFEIAQKLRLTHQSVYMNRLGLLHIFDEHPDVIPYEILKVPFDLKNGLWLQERANPNVFIVSREDLEQNKRYMVVLKSYEKGSEMWVSSYHRVHEKQTRSHMNRCNILRNALK